MDKVQEAGWTYVLPVLTQENVDLWVQKARQTVLQLQESVQGRLRWRGAEPVITMTLAIKSR